MNIWNKLLDYYKKGLKDMPRDGVYEALRWLDGKELDCGVCRCARKIFYEELGDSIVFKYCMEEPYWHDPPFMCSTIPEFETALQKRIDILEEICSTSS